MMKTNTRDENNFSLDIEEMLKAGLHFGHRISKVNPRMKPYLQGTRNTVHIIDLEKTKEKLQEALKFVQELISQNKNLLLVGTKVQIKNIIKEAAVECGLPYVSERWLGGTFTNFEVIKKRIEYYKKIEKEKETGELEKYTKKEKIKINKELERLRIKFEGIKSLDRLPEAIFVADMDKNFLAAKEARKMGIKIIAIVDTNIDPTLVDYPIPANDDTISSLKYICEKITTVIKKAKSQNLNSQ